MIKYGEVISEAQYRVLDILKLPDDLKDEIMDKQNYHNDTAKIVNPEFYPALQKWLEEHGEDKNECFIGWCSW